MSELTELESADAYCRYLTKRHYENFSVVSLFLPESRRTHLARIYGFCRTTDDYGDESAVIHGRQVGLRRLEAWREEVQECFIHGRVPIHPVLTALIPTIRDCRLEESLFLDLIQANIQDQSVSSYATWEELRGYCMLSAAPVGRMVLRIFGVDAPTAQALSDDVCVGLQLANHAQDVKRDAAKGRSYLLQDVVAGAGIPAGVRDLCDRAEDLLRSGAALEAMVGIGLRAQLALYRLGGMEVVSEIRRMEYHTDQWRPAVSTWTKTVLIPKAILQSVARIEYATPQRAA